MDKDTTMKIDSTPAPKAHHAPMTDRRAFLAAAPALAVLTAGPALAAIPAGDPGLDRTIAAYYEAVRQAKLYSAAVFEPVSEHYQALCETIPHSVTKQTLPGRTEGLSTADEGLVRMARALAGEKVFEGGPDNATQELLRLADQREERIEALRQEMGLDEKLEHSDRLFNAAGDILTAVEDYPVRSLADLVRKLEISEAEGFPEVPLDRLLADLRRIEGKGDQLA
jgi:hypothetical protein